MSIWKKYKKENLLLLGNKILCGSENMLTAILHFAQYAIKVTTNKQTKDHGERQNVVSQLNLKTLEKFKRLLPGRS